MASTYTPIATTTLGSATNSYTFTSIPSTYTDLILVMQTKVTAGSYQNNIQVGNGSIDTGTNYSTTLLNADGSTAYSTRGSNQTSTGGYADYNTTADGQMSVFHFMNYANTSVYKTMLSRGSNANTGLTATVALWRSTSAINQIKVFASGSTYTAGSTFTLYGIAAA